jgi:hypothetical protein
MTSLDLRFFDALPLDLLPHLISFLSGYDLLPLSHVDKRFHKELLGANSAFWKTHAPREMRIGPYKWRELATFGWRRIRIIGQYRRGPHNEAVRRRSLERIARREQEQLTRALELRADAKRHYFESVSLQFPGLRSIADVGSHRARRHRESGRVRLHEQGLDVGVRWASESFSFDLWLALLPPETSSGVVGGVLFSAASMDTRTVVTQFVHVDPHGGLYCSVASGVKHVIATLALSRWYHLALTLDRSSAGSDTVQCVYLDGVCIDTQRSDAGLHEYWRQLALFELGTGYVDERCVGVPELQDNSGFRWITNSIRRWRGGGRQFRGNYSFNGLLDDFRMWRGVLTASDVQALSQCQEDAVKDRVDCSWSLTADGDYHYFRGELWAVQCTRPSERICLHVHQAFRVEGSDVMPNVRARQSLPLFGG